MVLVGIAVKRFHSQQGISVGCYFCQSKVALTKSICDTTCWKHRDLIKATVVGILTGNVLKDPDAVIVVMTPIHRMTEDEPSMGNGLPLSAYINTIRETAESYSIPVLDLYAGALIQPKLPVNRERFCPDGLHPNDAGYRKIAGIMQAFLENAYYEKI